MGKKIKLETLSGLDWQAKCLHSAMKVGLPALLIGETGTGKTSLVKEVAATLGLNVVRVNLDGGTTPDELVGRFQLRGSETYFQHGIIVKAMKEGAVLLLDELNAALADTLFCVQAVLENPSCLIIPETGETILPAPGFCVVATMNPSHDYAGTKGLNPALYSRFSQVLRFKPLAGKELVTALASHVPDAAAEVVVRVAAILEATDKARRDSVINTRLSIRDGIAALIYATDGLSVPEALRASLLDKLEEAEIEALPADIVRESKAKSPAPAAMRIGEMLSACDRLAETERRLAAALDEIESLNELRRLLDGLASRKPGAAPVTS